MKSENFKLIAFDDDNLLELKVLVERKIETLDEVHRFLDENISNYKNCKWWLIPIVDDNSEKIKIK